MHRDIITRGVDIVLWRWFLFSQQCSVFVYRIFFLFVHVVLSVSPSLTFCLCVSLSPVWRYGLCAKQETTWYLVMWCMQMISLSRLLILIWQRSELSGPLYIGNQICSCQLEGRNPNVCVCACVCHQARQSETENRWRRASESEKPVKTGII